MKCAYVLSSYLEMQKEFSSTEVREGILSKAFTVNLFCSAVNIVISLSLDF